MDDDELFRDAMRSLGVEPVDGGRRPARRPPEEKPPAHQERPKRRTAAPDDDDAYFLARMESLEVAPDKDRRTRRTRASGIRKLKAPKRLEAEPEAALDLHGQTVDEALRSLERFLLQVAGERLRTVIVVTGKGLRSQRGIGVLKGAVEQWLRQRGKRWVRAYSQAPRALGGHGAYVLHLR